MPLPKWATEKSKVKAKETPGQRILKQRIEQTIKKEQSDPDLAVGVRPRFTADGSQEALKIAELQYEGDVLNYHGYKFY